MKLKRIIFMLVCVLLLTGCNKNTYDYNGDELIYSLGGDAIDDINSNGANIDVGKNQAFVEISDDNEFDSYTRGNHKVDKKEEYYKYYFISLDVVKGNKFGSTTPVKINDNTYGSLDMNFYGMYDYQISNIKTFLSAYFRESTKSVLDIQSYVNELVMSTAIVEMRKYEEDYTSIAANNSSIKDNIIKSLSKIGIKCSNLQLEGLNLTDESMAKISKIDNNNLVKQLLIQSTSWTATDKSEFHFAENEFKWYQTIGEYVDNYQFGTYDFYIGDYAVEFITQDLKSFGVTTAELESLFASDEDFSREKFVVFEINLTGYVIGGQETIVNSPIYWYGFLLNEDNNLQVVNMSTATYYNFTKKSA